MVAAATYIQADCAVALTGMTVKFGSFAALVCALTVASGIAIAGQPWRYFIFLVLDWN